MCVIVHLLYTRASERERAIDAKLHDTRVHVRELGTFLKLEQSTPIMRSRSLSLPIARVAAGMWNGFVCQTRHEQHRLITYMTHML